jgi:23S rRNA pseudouridine2605 synthase
MRLNKYIAQSTGLSRRAADAAIQDGRVHINGLLARVGSTVEAMDNVLLDNRPISASFPERTILFNKPRGYVVSRNGQGSKTIYDLLPPELHHLKPIGRLDKYSSGLLLLTTDGERAQRLTHPRYHKVKRYEVSLSTALVPLHRQMIDDVGIMLDDGVSKLTLERLVEGNDARWMVSMHEGRNRQIRRTFEALGYKVTRLHRVQFGEYSLGTLGNGSYRDSA